MACVWRKCLLAMAAALTLCPAVRSEAPVDDVLDILFIGNSLTYRNDLPSMLGELLIASGFDVARIEAAAYPDYGLVDHWRDRRALALLEDGDWDIVILQQGPSATEGRPSLLEYSRKFAPRIEAVGARPALYMVWPAASRSFDFAGVAESYRMAAKQVDGLLFPVGEAWLAAWELDPDMELYGVDGFHPSRSGTALAALIMAQVITAGEVDLETVDSVLSQRGVAPKTIPTLMQAAEMVLSSGD